MATVSVPLDVMAARFAASAFPEMYKVAGTNFPVMALAFDDTTLENIYFHVPLYDFGSGLFTVAIGWYGRTGQVTGNCRWGARVSVPIPNVTTTSFEALTFNTANTNTTGVGANAKAAIRTTITSINAGAGPASGDTVILNVYRDAANVGDTLTGDAGLLDVTLRYSDT